MSKDTNAGGVVAGFIYQIYYFLYRLLAMQEGETVSLEKFEDVGSEKGDKKTYYQLKHTVATRGTTVARMRDRDTDLWKTLGMWIDKIEEHGDEATQRKWIAESEFVLLSNKSTEENTFFQKVKAYQKEGKWDELKQFIEVQAAKGSTTDASIAGEKRTKSIREYTKHVNEFALLKEFLDKVDTQLMSDDDIKAKIDYLLVNRHHFNVPNAMVLRGTLYERVAGMLTGKELAFTLESFHTAFGELVTEVRDRKCVPKNREVSIPVEPRKQTFIRQLVDIDDYMAQSKEDIEDLTLQKLQFENDYNDALAVGDDDDRIIFEKDVKARWKKHHKKYNNGISASNSGDEVKQAAQTVLEEVRNEHPVFDQDILNETSSNGCFYYFSDGDKPKIGWRYDWKEKYNGEEWTIE